MPGRVIKVHCKCGMLLFRYLKGGRGRLIKCFLDHILEDAVGLDGLQNDAVPVCPNCGKSLGIIRLVHGKPALKLNQGTIKEIRI